MGYADMLLMKEIAYGSQEALDILEEILAFMEKVSIAEYRDWETPCQITHPLSDPLLLARATRLQRLTRSLMPSRRLRCTDGTTLRAPA